MANISTDKNQIIRKCCFIYEKQSLDLTFNDIIMGIFHILCHLIRQLNSDGWE